MAQRIILLLGKALNLLYKITLANDQEMLLLRKKASDMVHDNNKYHSYYLEHKDKEVVG